MAWLARRARVAFYTWRCRRLERKLDRRAAELIARHIAETSPRRRRR